MGGLSVGYGIQEITPPLGTPFGGFAIERLAGATGVHDPLHATAIVACDGDCAVAVVSCDLQLVAPHVIAVARRRIERATGIMPDAVMVHATHVHSAPGGDAAEATIRGLDSYFSTPAVEELVADRIALAVTEAWSEARSAQMSCATGFIKGIGNSRHQPLAGGQFGAVVRFERSGAAPIVLAHHGCHASVLGPENTEVSSDYPGVLRRAAAARGEQLLFLNGPAGDISTRATRREQTFAEVERLGGDLDEQLLDLAGGCTTLEGDEVAWRHTTVTVPARSFDRAALDAAVEKAQAHLAAADDASRPAAEQALRRDQFWQQRLSRFQDTHLDIELQALRIGGLAVLGVGGELFSALGTSVCTGSPFAATLIAAPVNGSVGNIPTPELAPEVSAMVVAGAGLQVVEAAVRLLGRLAETGVLVGR